MTAAVVIGVGNIERRDDGFGPAVAVALAGQCPATVRVVTCALEPTAILDAWDGVALAVVVDAAAGPDAVPGRVRACTVEDVAGHSRVSSHELNLSQTYDLGRALGRAPRRLVVIAVDAADMGHGRGLTPAVAAAVPIAATLVRAEVAREAG
ncbi:hydrogenase maturation protease [Mycolicibacterium sp. CBM1]